MLAVLMLRGPQTLGELKQRTERLQGFGSSEEVVETLDALARRELVVRLARRPGQKEERWIQLLGGETTGDPDEVARRTDDGVDRIAALEERLARLEAAFDELAGKLAGRE